MLEVVECVVNTSGGRAEALTDFGDHLFGGLAIVESELEFVAE